MKGVHPVVFVFERGVNDESMCCRARGTEPQLSGRRLQVRRWSESEEIGGGDMRRDIKDMEARKRRRKQARCAHRS
jgi:hypothetical protein